MGMLRFLIQGLSDSVWKRPGGSLRTTLQKVAESFTDTSTDGLLNSAYMPPLVRDSILLRRPFRALTEKGLPHVKLNIVSLKLFIHLLPLAPETTAPARQHYRESWEKGCGRPNKAES